MDLVYYLYDIGFWYHILWDHRSFWCNPTFWMTTRRLRSEAQIWQGPTLMTCVPHVHDPPIGQASPPLMLWVSIFHSHLWHPQRQHHTTATQKPNPIPQPGATTDAASTDKVKDSSWRKKHPVMIGLFFDVVGLSALQGLQLMKSLEDKFSTQSRNPDHFAMFFWGEFQVVRCCWCCFLGKELELRWQLVSGGVIWLIDIFSLGLCSAMSLNLFPPESLSSIFINHWSSIQHWWSQAGMDDTGWNLMARQSWWFLKSWMLGNWQIIIDVSEYLCFTVLQCHVYLHRCDMNFIYRYVRIYKNEYRLHTSIRTYMYMKHVI